MNINSIEIGNGMEPLVIPELGINHGGSLKVAMEIVDAAYRAGAKLIKHQTHIPWDEMSKAAKNTIPGNAKVSIYEIMEACALDEDEELELKKYVESKGLIYLSTPFSRAAVDRLERLSVGAYKIGSGEMNNYPLVEYIANIGKPTILSTGMNTMDAVRKAAEIFQKKGTPFALLHTTNLYPTPAHLVRLGGMQQLQKEFPGVPVGLSDHTVNNNACFAALALGAQIVERHFVDRKDRVGPDVICSMDEQELKNLIGASREIPQMLGGVKGPAMEEKVTIDFAFSSVVTIKTIKRGEIFSEDNIWVKRPGRGGICAEKYYSIIGKKARMDIEEDSLLSEEMIEEK